MTEEVATYQYDLPPQQDENVNHRRRTTKKSHPIPDRKANASSRLDEQNHRTFTCIDYKTLRYGMIFIHRHIKAIAVVIVLSGMCYISSALSAATDHAIAAQIGQDYSDVKSLEDLQKMHNKIEDICYPGMKEVCSCTDPMQPIDRQGQRHWLKASHENSDEAKAASNNEIDVVFLGDSIIEGWKGTSYGFRKGNKDGNLSVFQKLLTREGGSKYEGLLLGISGDTASNLLWRIQHKELPTALNPPVIWLLIGLNDIYSKWCSPEATLTAILRVVEELKISKPGSTIVINGLLPFSHDKKQGYVQNKKRWGLVHHRKNPPAIWDDILAINKQLQAYSLKEKRVEYFEANDIFLADSYGFDVNNPKIDKNLMSDYVHPTKFGYQLWGDLIVKKLDEIISVEEN